MTKSVSSTVIVLLALIVGGCDSPTKLAEVNGRAITEQEFNRYLKFKRVPQQDEKRVQRMLDDYIRREALAGAAEDSQYIDAAQIEAELSDYRRQLLISRHFENYLDDVVNDQAVRNYYNTHKDEFQQQKVKVAHVLVRTREDMSEQERRARLTLAQEVYSKATSGEPFEKLAEQYSEDTVSAKRGGEIGWLKRGAIDPAFSKKAFSLPAGDVSRPFKTPFGFHVLKVLEAPKTVTTPFETAKGNIAYRLRQQAKQAETERLLESAEIERP